MQGGPTRRKLELFKLAQAGDLAATQCRLAGDGQSTRMSREAASTSWFVAGWRPFISWICGTGLGYVAIVRTACAFRGGVVWLQGVRSRRSTPSPDDAGSSRHVGCHAVLSEEGRQKETRRVRPHPYRLYLGNSTVAEPVVHFVNGESAACQRALPVPETWRRR